MTLENVASCPVCATQSLKLQFVAKDHTVTQQDFSLQQCTHCKLLITSPRPDLNSISLFYQSDKYISHTGGNKSFFDQLYLKARRFTLQWKWKLVTRYKKSGTLLDYGCGTGEFLNAMKKKGWGINGVEPSESARLKARLLTQNEIESDLGKIDQRYDVITLWHVLEHIHDLNEKISELKLRLKPDGIIFIAVPNYESADSNKYGPYWAGYDVPRHLWHFTQTSMKILLSKHGLNLIGTKPLKLDSFYVSLLSENYKNPKKLSLMRISSALFAGLSSNLSARRTGQYSSLIYIASFE